MPHPIEHHVAITFQKHAPLNTKVVTTPTRIRAVGLPIWCYYPSMREAIAAVHDFYRSAGYRVGEMTLTTTEHTIIAECVITKK